MEKDEIDWSDIINWELVREIGVMQGATRHAVNKWKQRKMVPHKWRSYLVRGTGGDISWLQFEMMDRARKAS
jgi:hypothetical protein